MKKISIGIENFKRLIDDGFYYIDKTLWIKDILDEQFALYTRPRRFGKTLNMSMLYYFFSNKEKDSAYLFNDLAISKDKEAMKYQNQYPVIFLTLKDMKNNSFDEQKEQFLSLIQDIIDSYYEILDSKKLSKLNKSRLNRILEGNCSTKDLENSIKYISMSLKQVYNKNVIVLIDEYDVPLQAAYTYHYYDEMVLFLKSVFSAGLKTNDAVEKGIFTGCLRISKESIFTGLNHFNVYSVLQEQSSQYFGFTKHEVNQLLADYHMQDSFDVVKEWYDGYLFGSNDIYNPWSVLKFVLKAKQDKAEPESFWANTSGNDIVVDYISQSDETLHEEFEKLMQGKVITKSIKTELTYRDMDNMSNIYSFLLMTGYLKVHKEIVSNEVYELIIPNKEVYKIYDQSFMDYFNEVKIHYKNELIHLLSSGEVKKLQTTLNDILDKSISYYDNYESFYHGFLLGLFQDLEVTSNKESGDGRFDIEILPRRLDGTVIIIECKHSDILDNLIDDSKKAANQIIDKRYLSNAKYQKYNNRVGYGISFFKKQCYITKV